MLATDGNAAVRACQVLELAQFMTAHSSQVRLLPGALPKHAMASQRER